MTGCTKVSEGCRNCYAERMAKRLVGRYGYPARDPFLPTLHSYERLEEPLRWRKPRTVFVCSMGDLFHQAVPTSFILEVWKVMERCYWHRFLVLTKRPERMELLFSALPLGEIVLPMLPNVWVGTSVEDQATADVRIPYLLRCWSPVRFLSVEPLLGPVDLRRVEIGDRIAAELLDLVIAGGESGPRARPCDVDWLRALRDQCHAAAVPFFLKQLGRACRMSRVDAVQPVALGAGWASDAPHSERGLVRFVDAKGGNPDEWPEDLRVRQWPEARP